jgi:hypothetical protein
MERSKWVNRYFPVVIGVREQRFPARGVFYFCRRNWRKLDCKVGTDGNVSSLYEMNIRHICNCKINSHQHNK